MKTPEQWAGEYYPNIDNITDTSFQEMVALIQSDAKAEGWREGMTDAAEIVQHLQFPMQQFPKNSRYATAILAARNKGNK